MNDVTTVYAVETGEYSDRSTDVLFTTEALAEAYIAARIAAAIAYDKSMDWDYGDTYANRWEVVTYQLWTVVPVVPEAMSNYDELWDAQP